MKRALLIGCNYPGSQYELHGCVRDIEKIYPVLQRNFGFNEIRVMLDTQSSYEDSPTGRNIKVNLPQLTASGPTNTFSRASTCRTCYFVRLD